MWGSYKNQTCNVDDCKDPAYCRWMCSRHYYRWVKWGDPSVYKGNKLPYGRASANEVLRRYRRDANRRGIELLLSDNEMLTIFQQNCYYCGVSPDNEYRRSDKNYRGSFVYNGLDRLDNSEGYTMFNVVPCCGVCNRMKSDLSGGDFIEHIEKIFNRRIER